MMVYLVVRENTLPVVVTTIFNLSAWEAEGGITL